jgi:prepilin-type N-terminal cleavage/methylation domain-containing protein
MKNSLLKAAQRGLTMVEISVSLAIVGMGLLAIIGVMPAILAVSRSAVEASECAIAAQDYFENDFGSNLMPTDIWPNSEPPSSCTETNVTLTKSSTPKWVDRPSFKAGVCISYTTPTNWEEKAYVPVSTGERLLTTKSITLSYPPPAGPKAKYQTYTFVTEMAATSNITVKDL